jgi:hypothetical protein
MKRNTSMSCQNESKLNYEPANNTIKQSEAILHNTIKNQFNSEPKLGLTIKQPETIQLRLEAKKGKKIKNSVFFKNEWSVKEQDGGGGFFTAGMRTIPCSPSP